MATTRSKKKNGPTWENHHSNNRISKPFINHFWRERQHKFDDERSEPSTASQSVSWLSRWTSQARSQQSLNATTEINKVGREQVVTEPGFFALSECLNLWMKPRFSGDFIWLMTFEFELSETGSCRLVRISWPLKCWWWSWIWEVDSCEVIDAVVWLNCPRAFLFRGFSSGGSWVVKEIDGLGADHPRGEWFFFGSGVWKGLGLTKVSYLSNWDEEMQWIQATR